ncbi:MAG: hypothetical protein RR941_02540 [Erysipelotrichaceae bacterium]
MNIKDDIIIAFLNDNKIDCEFYDQIIEGKHLFQEPDYKRKEVVVELNKQIHEMMHSFSIFNSALFQQLFPNYDTFLADVTLMPVVGLQPPYDAFKTSIDQKDTLIIDLHQIANQTHEVDKMMYIIKNFITQEIVKMGIEQDYKAKDALCYEDKMAYLVFKEGLIHYLSWGDNIQTYQLYSEKYEEKRGLNFMKLSQALEIKEPYFQKKLLTMAIHGEFWDRFAIISGMFLWDILYQEQGIQGILDAYQKGWNTFIPKE